MFVGHFAAGLVAKKFAPKISLGWLFAGCQLLDLVWPVLVLLGIEKVKIDYQATEVTPFDFVSYPWSHSLVMTLVWSLVFASIVYLVTKSKRGALVSGVVVSSHWFLDFVSHRADMPLWWGSDLFGLGLWHSRTGTFVVESAFFLFGVFVYRAFGGGVNKKFWSLIGFLSVFYILNIFGPKPPPDMSPEAIAGPALSLWLIVFWAYMADRSSSAPPKS